MKRFLWEEFKREPILFGLMVACIVIFVLSYTTTIFAAELIYTDKDSCVVVEEKCQLVHVDSGGWCGWYKEVWQHDTTTYYRREEPSGADLLARFKIKRGLMAGTKYPCTLKVINPRPTHYWLDTVITKKYEWLGGNNNLRHWVYDTTIDTNWVFEVEE